MTWLPQTFGGKGMSLFFKEVCMIAKAKNGQASIWDLSKLNFIATCNIRSSNKILRKIWFCAKKVTLLQLTAN
jgi:hypothetical protein